MPSFADLTPAVEVGGVVGLLLLTILLLVKDVIIPLIGGKKHKPSEVAEEVKRLGILVERRDVRERPGVYHDLHQLQKDHELMKAQLAEMSAALAAMVASKEKEDTKQ